MVKSWSIDIERFKKALTDEFPYTPTIGQYEIIHDLAEFLCGSNRRPLFLFKGYAGTGKTTLISAFVKVLDKWRIRNRLLAPTGRAAKVLGGYAGKKAHTIHRYIYMVFTDATGKTVIVPRQPKLENVVFIVDEVSMIAGNDRMEDDSQPFSGRNLLSDLIAYAYGATNCKMIFVGDQAQLPPVGTSISPAMETKYLESMYDLYVTVNLLDEVVRQEAASGILKNATELRKKIASSDFLKPLFFENRRDVVRLYGNDLMDELSAAFSGNSTYSSVIITRSNKRANRYNQEVRYRLLARENEIEGGDMMMVVKNNYFWLPEGNPAGFIANGDIIEIVRVRNITEKYGLRFADALIKLTDYPREKEFEVKLLLSTIESENAALPRKTQLDLMHAVISDQVENKYSNVSQSEWYNALQVKFAYALTCHKTQGGQWDFVFLDQGWITDDMLGVEYFRWLYTATTRATQKLFLLGFNDEFVEMAHEDD